MTVCVPIERQRRTGDPLPRASELRTGEMWAIDGLLYVVREHGLEALAPYTDAATLVPPIEPPPV